MRYIIVAYGCIRETLFGKNKLSPHSQWKFKFSQVIRKTHLGTFFSFLPNIIWKRFLHCLFFCDLRQKSLRHERYDKNRSVFVPSQSRVLVTCSRMCADTSWASIRYFCLLCDAMREILVLLSWGFCYVNAFGFRFLASFSLGQKTEYIFQ